MITLNPEKECTDEKNGQDIELPLFDFPTIAKATNYFSVNNKLGEGGFGPVYKVTLSIHNYAERCSVQKQEFRTVKYFILFFSGYVGEGTTDSCEEAIEEFKTRA